MLYAYGVVLKEMQLKGAARKVLCESVCAAPINWSAWLDLASLCSEKEDVDQLVLPEHWMVGFFRAHLALELQQNAEAIEILGDLSQMFPDSSYVLAQKALAQYNLRNFDEAQELFEQLTAADPHRLHNMVSSPALGRTMSRADLTSCSCPCAAGHVLQHPVSHYFSSRPAKKRGPLSLLGIADPAVLCFVVVLRFALLCFAWAATSRSVSLS
jgi:tetratricopeptide (TPR) repeat protein